MTLHPLIWAIFALQALDAVTTIVALKKGGAEANPLAAKIFGAVGVIPGAIAVKLFVVGVVWHFRSDMQTWAMAAAVVAYVAIIVNNIKVIRRQKQ